MLLCPASPAGAYLSEGYTVFARPVGGTWEKVSVYTALTPDGISNWQEMPPDIAAEYDGVDHVNYALPMAIAPLFFDGEIEIRIRAERDVSKICVFPEVPFVRDGAEITLTLSRPCKLSVEPDGDIFSSLQIFADALPRTDAPAGYHVIRFGPGMHTAENSAHIEVNAHGTPVVVGVTDRTWIIAEPGAVVRAGIDLAGLHDVTVCGGGIFSLLCRCHGAETGFTCVPLYGGFRAHSLPSVYIHAGCRDITVRDVILLAEFRGITARNARGITSENVKILTSTANGDGVNLVRVCDAVFRDCYIRSADDCFAVFTSCDSVPALEDEAEFRAAGISANLTLEGSILWTSCRPIMIGGHASGRTDPRDTVENIRIRDCIIADDAMNVQGSSLKHRQYWTGVIRLLSQSGAIVRDITVENLRIRWTPGFAGKPFHIEVRETSAASYTESGGYRIEDVLLRNIAFEGASPERMASYIYAPEGGDCLVRGVHFQNVTVNGAPYSAEEVRCVGRTEEITLE